MSKIDWSKAPADAEAGCAETSETYAAWYRRNGSFQVEQICPKLGLNKWIGIGGRSDFPYGHELRPANWNGVGLPPVGTVCEFDGFNPEETLPTDPVVGDQVTVIAHFKSGPIDLAAFTFYAPPDFEFLQVGQGAHGCFRPMRTAEQNAADERAGAINEMVDNLKRWNDVHELCGMLYDANYRKQVIQ